MNLAGLLPNILPPVTGAIIGYVTNDIAIRMLFRPLKPWHILGIRIPLTPGVIPTNRLRLARKIGTMVGEYLLTPTELIRAVEGEPFCRDLRAEIHQQLDHLFEHDWGPLSSVLPSEFHERFHELARSISEVVVDAVFNYLAQEEMQKSLAKHLESVGRDVLQGAMEYLFTGERYFRIKGQLRLHIATFLKSQAINRRAVTLADEIVKEIGSSDGTLREMIPSEVLESLLAQLRQRIPLLMKEFGEALNDPSLSKELTARVGEQIQENFRSSGGLFGLLSHVVNIQSAVPRFPELIRGVTGGIRSWLEEEGPEVVAASLQRDLDRFLDLPLAEIFGDIPQEKGVNIRRLVRRQLLAFVRSPLATDLTLSLFEQGTEMLRRGTLPSLTRRILPPEDLRGMGEWIVHELRSRVGSPGFREEMTLKLQEKINAWFHQSPIGTLLKHIGPATRAEIEEILTHQTIRLLAREIPFLLKGLHLPEVIEEKVNTLDILTLEGLLLDIMQRHFVYINLFGALLGFVIGMINVIF